MMIPNANKDIKVKLLFIMSFIVEIISYKCSQNIIGCPFIGLYENYKFAFLPYNQVQPYIIFNIMT